MRRYIDVSGHATVSVTPEVFVETWTLASSAAEVAKRLSMTPSAVNTRAAAYRRLGVVLKRFPRVALPPRPRLDVGKLNSLVVATEDKLHRNTRSM